MRGMFIPPFILEKMAAAGIEKARRSLMVSVQTTETRIKNAPDVAMLMAVTIPPGATSSRMVYDCLHKWDYKDKTQIKLARSDGDPLTGDNAVDNAYELAGITRDFYKKVLNRNSIDNLGMNLLLSVHFGVDYDNAFWDGEEMVFGDGDGVYFTSFANSLDVIAHELSHGVTQYLANFNYSDQPGALHEHFSDVLGTVITQYANKETAEQADWLIGDEIMGPELYGEALRSMKEPGTAYDNPLFGTDPQPSHMKDIYTGPADNGGVHINSGIMNKAFYLSAIEIGTDKAAVIWYHALQSLYPTAQFADASKQIVNSARLLTKAKQVPLGSPQKVRAAFKAVGLYP